MPENKLGNNFILYIHFESKTLILNLRYLSTTSKHGNDYESKSWQKIQSGAQKRLGANTDKLLSTPATKPAPNEMALYSLDIVNMAKRGSLVVWEVHCLYRPSLRSAPCSGHSVLTIKVLNFHETGCNHYLVR